MSTARQAGVCTRVNPAFAARSIELAAKAGVLERAHVHCKFMCTPLAELTFTQVPCAEVEGGGRGILKCTVEGGGVGGERERGA